MTTSAIEIKRAYSIDEISLQLGISRNHAYAMARAGKIPAIRLGKRFIVPRDRYEAWLAGDREGAG